MSKFAQSGNLLIFWHCEEVCAHRVIIIDSFGYRAQVIAFIPGLLAGLSLIIAIGAQNAFVIKQGLTKEHVFLTVAICSAADALLSALGAAGLGRILQSHPTLLEIIRWFGVIYLIWFGT